MTCRVEVPMKDVIIFGDSYSTFNGYTVKGMQAICEEVYLVTI